MTELTNEAYHDRREVSASMLKLMDESWRVFQASCVTRTLRREPTPSMELGTAVHTAALEPQRFELEYVIQPDKLNDRRTKAYKEWSETIHHSQTILKQETAATVENCVASLKSHPMIALALEADGKVERSCFWSDSATQVPCKFRPDKIVPASGIVLDIKTMQSCSERDFQRAVIDFRYDLQASHYIEGASEVFGGSNADWVFLFACVETKPPYRCRAFSLDSEALGIGFDTRERLLSEYVHRLNDDDWSDPGERELVTVSLPNWFLRKASV